MIQMAMNYTELLI